MKQISFLIIIAFVNMTFGQQKTSAQLSSIHKDGLHEINVPHTIRSFSNKDLSDFRILDSNQKEVPYFIRRKSNYTSTNEFEVFKITSKVMVKDTSSTIVFQNPNANINQVVITLANYAGSKTFNLSGSNDQTQWFGLVNKKLLNNIQDASKTSIDKTISFPLCSYRYLKIEFNDLNSLPVNILRVGNSSNLIENRALNEIMALSKKVSVDLKQKKTQIHVTFKNKEYLNYLSFNITDPQHYKRKASLYKISSRMVKKEQESYKETLATFELNSNNVNTFDVKELFENELFIEIENEDNPSLIVNEIRFLQKPVFVIADLKMNESYSVKTEDENLKAPQYDLSFFNATISENLPIATITSIKRNTVFKKEVTSDSFWQNSWFMWLCISIAAIAIVYFTSGLLKDLKKE